MENEKPLSLSKWKKENPTETKWINQKYAKYRKAWLQDRKKKAKTPLEIEAEASIRLDRNQTFSEDDKPSEKKEVVDMGIMENIREAVEPKKETSLPFNKEEFISKQTERFALAEKNLYDAMQATLEDPNGVLISKCISAGLEFMWSAQVEGERAIGQVAKNIEIADEIAMLAKKDEEAKSENKRQVELMIEKSKKRKAEIVAEGMK